MGEFKSKEFHIDLNDHRMDNAQHIMFSIIKKLNLNLGDKLSTDQVTKTILNKITNERYGIPIGYMSSLYGEFEFYINGIPQITNPIGEAINSSESFRPYLTGELDIKTLHFEKMAYITVINKTHPDNYYGVFYSLRDAIKIASDNNMVKVGEITS